MKKHIPLVWKKCEGCNARSTSYNSITFWQFGGVSMSLGSFQKYSEGKLTSEKVSSFSSLHSNHWKHFPTGKKLGGNYLSQKEVDKAVREYGDGKRKWPGGM